MFWLSNFRYDIADIHDNNIDLKSPVEKAMSILRELQKDHRVPNSLFLEVRKVINYLGMSNDIFKPQIEEQLQINKNIKLDIDTERWIIDLVQEHPSTRRGRGETVSNEDVESSSMVAFNPSAHIQNDEEKQFQQRLLRRSSFSINIC